MRYGLLSLLLCGVAAAQNISSGLSGTLMDASGAAVPNAKISARNALTGFQRDTKSNDSGYFGFPDLTPGDYSLAITADGFKKHSQAGIPLNSGEQRSMGRIKLDVGATTDTVTWCRPNFPVAMRGLFALSQCARPEPAGWFGGSEL